MTDHYTDELFAGRDNFKYFAVIFPISRACVDPERFRDDAQETIAEKGMGVVYTHSQDGSPIQRELINTERLGLLAEYYDPHHDRFETLVGERLI